VNLFQRIIFSAVFSVSAVASTLASGQSLIVLSSPLNFGNVTVNTTKSETLTVPSFGSSAVTIESFALTGGNTTFSRTGGTCPNTFLTGLAGNSSCTVLVDLAAPSTVGPYSSALKLASDTANSSVPTSASVEGASTPPTISPAMADFGLGNVANNNPTGAFYRVFTLTNVSSTPLSLFSFLGNPVRALSSFFFDSPAYYLVSGGPDRATSCFVSTSVETLSLRSDAIAPGQSCAFSVRLLSVTAPGNFDNTITVITNQGNVSFAIKASVGSVEHPVHVTPEPLTFSRVSYNVATNAGTLTLKNPAPVPATIFDLVIPAPFQRVGGTCATTFPSTLAVAESCTVNLVVPAVASPFANSGVPRSPVTAPYIAYFAANTGNVDVKLNVVTGEDDPYRFAERIPTHSPIGIAGLVVLLVILTKRHLGRATRRP
jgi:hypothetical protein